MCLQNSGSRQIEGKKELQRRKNKLNTEKWTGHGSKCFCGVVWSAGQRVYYNTRLHHIHISNTRVNAVSVFGRSRVPIVRYVNEWIVAAMLWPTTQYSHRHNDRISLHTSYTHSICVIDRRWCVRQALNNTNSKEARLHCLMVEQ